MQFSKSIQKLVNAATGAQRRARKKAAEKKRRQKAAKKAARSRKAKKRPAKRKATKRKAPAKRRAPAKRKAAKRKAPAKRKAAKKPTSKAAAMRTRLARLYKQRKLGEASKLRARMRKAGLKV